MICTLVNNMPMAKIMKKKSWPLPMIDGGMILDRGDCF